MLLRMFLLIFHPISFEGGGAIFEVHNVQTKVTGMKDRPAVWEADRGHHEYHM